MGPESPAIVYANDVLVGVSTDCRALTKETCGIAIVDDQQSLIADLILDLGLTKSSCCWSHSAQGRILENVGGCMSSV